MKRGVNIFSHNGGVALGLKDEIQFILFTSYNEILKGELLKKMDSGELPRAPVLKFAYTITPNTVVMGADIVVGLVHHQGWQEKELSIPDPQGRFPRCSLSPESVHRASLYESFIVARACKAMDILLFFPYDPLAANLETMEVIKNQRVFMRCFEFPLQGKYIPTSHLYALEIRRLGRRQSPPPRDVIEIVQLSSSLLAIKVNNLPPPTETEKKRQKRNPLTPDETFSKRSALVWDIAPGIIQEAMQKMKEIVAPSEGEAEEQRLLLKIYNSVGGGESRGEAWDYRLSNSSLLDFAGQGTAAGSLGW